MKEMQQFTKQFQEEMGWSISQASYAESRTSLLNNYMLLTTEVAEVAEELRKAFNLTHRYMKEGMEEEAAFQLAIGTVKADLAKELADCLAYMLKFTNFFEIDLEDSFYAKMDEVKHRQNKDVVNTQKSRSGQQAGK